MNYHFSHATVEVVFGVFFVFESASGIAFKSCARNLILERVVKAFTQNKGVSGYEKLLWKILI